MAPSHQQKDTQRKPETNRTDAPALETNNTSLPKDRPYIAGVGASAGGLEALERLFKNMPHDSGIAFVLVPHLDPEYKSLMPELIQKYSHMPVIRVTDGTQVKPDTIYIVPPNHNLAILKGVLQLMPPRHGFDAKMPIDYFFSSLAQDQGSKAIGIILSGMGTDGTLGLKDIKAALGMAMVQTPDTAKFNSMPKNAVNAGLADYALPCEKIPAQLMAYIDTATRQAVDRLTASIATPSDALQKIFILLRAHTGHDFSSYRQSTVSRRIDRRMNVHQFHQLETYARYFQENPLEVEALFKEFLIGVTDFFRDNDAFDALKQKAIPQLLDDKPHGYTARAWVPGCASGEEAYSVAIVLYEYTRFLTQTINIRIFGTDIDAQAVNTARAGVYPAGLCTEISPQRLNRFFTKMEGRYKINANIRDLLVFATQSLVKDPPFSNMDLICCRNLLIYFEPDLQNKLLPVFHYSLKPNGILFLGASETIGNFRDLFTPIDQKWKIYRRNTVEHGGHTAFSLADISRRQTPEKEKTAALDIVQTAQNELLKKFAPPTVLIDPGGDIRYVHGRTGQYLEPAPGGANVNIFEMARKNLNDKLPVLVRQAVVQRKEIRCSGIIVEANGGTKSVAVRIAPVSNSESDLLLVSFEDETSSVNQTISSTKTAGRSKTSCQTSALEQELRATREDPVHHRGDGNLQRSTAKRQRSAALRQ